MIDALQEVLPLGETLFWRWFSAFLRVGGIVALAPVFGEQTVPVRVRLGIAVVLSTALAPAVPGTAAGSPISVFAILAEVTAGFALGIVLRLFVMALQAAGAIAAQSTSLSQILGTSGVEPMPAIGHVLLISGLALAATMDLHLYLVHYVVQSYALFPAGIFPDPAALSKWGLAQVSQSFALAFQLAAPFVLGSVIYNLTLGVINRAMPQLMVAFVGAPVITAGGLVLLLLTAPLLLSVWIEGLMQLMSDPAELG